jgi:hypothetical protein
MEIFVFASIASYVVRYFTGQNVASPLMFLIPFIVFMGLEILSSMIALAMEKERLFYSVWTLAFIFPYRQFLNIIKIIAFFKVYIFKKDVKWNKLKRTGIPSADLAEKLKE